MKPDVLERIFDGSIKPRDIKLSTLERITGNFSEDQKIGEGGFGTVYKGVLQNGEVAVKRIRNNHTIDEKLFRREVDSLLNVSHKNIVRFLGFCSNTEHKAIEYEGSRQHIYAETRERILCFEYINNGSLERYVADELRGLQWDTRYFIIKGICEGLQYLHMEMHIVHMDLKPANILIDYGMVAKITDFGLSRMEENSQTKSTNRTFSLGYTAPEYLHNGKMSVKSDVYSLGIIIIELVTGHRSIPDNDINNVLRRWRHTLRKSGEELPFRYQQITKLIEIGLLCQEEDPCKRPFINEIINGMNKLESMEREISNLSKSTVGQISAYSEDDMLGIEPLELRFPFELNNQISCSLELTNETSSSIAFSIQTTIPLPYHIQPNKGIVSPRSKYSIDITLQPIEKAPQDKLPGDFIVRSTKVKDHLKSEDITEDIFKKEEGKLVDEVNLTVTYKAEIPQLDESLRSPIISDTRNLHGPQESTVPQTEEDSVTSDEVIQFDPPKICFPLVPDKKVLSSIKIINTTESYVSVCFSWWKKNTANYYFDNCTLLLPPRSKDNLVTVTRLKKEDEVKDMQFNDNIRAWYAIVAEDIKPSDLDLKDYNEWKNLPIVLTKVDSCASSELVQFDPPELSFPCQNKTSLSSINIVNITDCYIGFNTWWFGEIDARYETEPRRGILPPGSNQRMVVKRIPYEEGVEDMQSRNNIFMWNMIVAEGIEASSLNNFENGKDSKEIPFSFQTISPCIPDELIQLDHPGLRFTFSQNKIAFSSFNMVNVTDYCVGFRLFNSDLNGLGYIARPEFGILAPHSAQRVVVAMEDTQYNGKFIMWNAIVSEGIKASDLSSNLSAAEGEQTELPILLNEATSSTSVELTKFEPPEVRFPFLPSKNLVSSFKIVNNTEYHIGFNTRAEETNVALYITEPASGILPPWSTQELVVTRVAKEEAPELDDMQSNDKYYVWSCFVTEDVNGSDMEEWMPITERKELPIIFTETSSNELIQFDPPELCLPLLPNQRVLSSSKMVNITDQYIGFRICPKKSNLARYNVSPSEGILPPRSMQLLLITKIAEEKELEDSQCTDKFLVWNSIVTEGVKASDVIHNMPETKCTEFPIVVTETSSSTISNELIQFNPSEIQFPFLPNKKASTSIKIVNLTDYNVGFNTYSTSTNAAWYHTEPPRGILPPRSTQKLIVTREEKEDALKDKQFNDKYFVWKSIVSEGVKDNDLSDYMADQESMELPIILDQTSSLNSDELIQLDPAELCIPLLLKKKMSLFVNIVNTTDFYVAFNAYYKSAAAGYTGPKGNGILPPRCTKKLTFGWRTSEQEFEDVVPEGDYFVWNRVVNARVESTDIIGYMGDEESKKLPVIFNKASPCTTNGLIQFDPPELSLPLPNKPLVFSVNITNITNFSVSFDIRYPARNLGTYDIDPVSAVMTPCSTQRIVVKMTPKNKELEDGQYKDALTVYSHLVREGVVDHIYYEVGKEFPIVYKKTSLCTSDELIQLDPPQLSFPFLPNKRVSMLRLFKIVNITDHIVSFNIDFDEDNCAWYKTEPDIGILPPQSTQVIKIRRTLKENKTEVMQCKDKILVNGNVTEGVQFSDVGVHWKNHDIELPVVLTKPGSSSR